jgi:hypothetical protein
MRIATGFSLETDTVSATRKAYAKLVEGLGAAPRWIVAQASVPHDVEALRRELSALAPGASLHGSTSCLGVMTEAGFHSADGTGLGLLGAVDEQGAFGVGAERLGADPEASAREAMRRAIKDAARPGEVPSLVWLSAPPGAEETVIRGIEGVVGSEVPIVGGSSADNTVEGHWKQFTSEGTFGDAIVVSALFPSTSVASSFMSGYSPTGVSGRVTRAAGRKIIEIDGRPAAVVYNEWTKGAVSDALPAGGNVLGKTTLHPLGRKVGTAGGSPYFRLAHPDSVTADGSLTVFADVSEGDELILMAGSTEGLVTRAGRVAEEALQLAGLRPDTTAGALVVFCAGCMLTVTSRMSEVVAGLDASLGGRPFLGVFTFGEQGCLAGGENRHGNLMISVTTFGKPASAS